MSEGFATPPPPAPGSRVRPGTVTVAGLLMLLLLLASVVYLVASIATFGDLSDAFEEAYAGTDLEGSSGLLAGSQIGIGVVFLLVATTLTILSIFNNQGRNGARITTWVIGGIGICCGGVSLFGTLFTNVGTMQQEGANLPDPSEVERILSDHVPGWYGPVTLAATVVGILALIVALILLALPPSNAFFRKAPPAVEPPPGYPPVG